MQPMTASDREDLVGLLDYAWARLRDRLRGLDDVEWAWTPSAEQPKISIRWRLSHIVETLTETRNWLWLGVEEPAGGLTTLPRSAAEAWAQAESAYLMLRSVLSSPQLHLDAEIGAAAGPYATSTRRSFLLHLTDELVHHGAEAALLRDLYPVLA